MKRVFVEFYLVGFLSLFTLASPLQALTRECVQHLKAISEAPDIFWSHEDFKAAELRVRETLRDDKPEVALHLYLKTRLKNHRSLSLKEADKVFGDYLKRVELFDTPDKLHARTQYDQMKVYAPKALHSSLLIGMIKAHELSHFLIDMQLGYEFLIRFRSQFGTRPSSGELSRYLNPTLKDKFFPLNRIESKVASEKLAMREQWEYLQVFPEGYVESEVQKLKQFSDLNRKAHPDLVELLDLLTPEIEERNLPFNVWLQRARARGHYPRSQIESSAWGSAILHWIMAGVPLWLGMKIF